MGRIVSRPPWRPGYKECMAVGGRPVSNLALPLCGSQFFRSVKCKEVAEMSVFGTDIAWTFLIDAGGRGLF